MAELIGGADSGWTKEPRITWGPDKGMTDTGPAVAATLTMAITLSILDGFAKFFHCCKQQ